MRIAYLDGPRLRRSLLAACDYAQRQRGELNRINVFPVPDGDTGTNLALTIRAIADHLRDNEDLGVAGVAREAAQAAVLGARGNCGMMLSHFLLGFAQGVNGNERIGTRDFAAALRSGVDNLAGALDHPVEGTILTVMRDTADAAERATDTDFEDVVAFLVAEARASLARTPDMLPVLKSAGVVDAGAKGFVSLLEGVLLFVHGDPLVAASGEARFGAPSPTADEGARGRASAAQAEFPGASEQYRFCTEALVRGADLPSQGAVQAYLRDGGDSLIVIRSGDVLKVHVHTDAPERVFAYLRGVGTLVTHKAEDMRAQYDALERAAENHVQLARRPVTVFTDSACDLPEEVVRAHGIHVTPMLLIDGDRSLRDGIDVSARDFHARLGADAPVPTTSQPAPADFLEMFARAAEEGEALVGVVVGSALSGTLSSASAAAGRFAGAPVHLVDSCGASLLEGLMVLKACELAELAMEPEAIVAEVQRIRGQSGLIFTVDTFDRLLASGRVGRGRALLGSVLSVKPILSLTPDGRVIPIGRAMGRNRARSALLALLADRVPAGAKVRFGIVYVGDHSIVDGLRAALQSRYGADVETLTSPATPVLAAHLGLGAWGIAYLVED